MPTKKVNATEAPKVEAPEKTSEVVTPQAPKEIITFTEYLKRHAVGPLLVASFSYEASKVVGGTDPRTEDEWKEALVAQSKRVYK